jgi:hypothetical protein
MQVEGWGYQSKIARAAKEFSLHGEFHQLVLRYTQAQFIQSTQTAGCNAHHPLEQRLARWLLLCHDRIGNGHIAISQEFIAQMLGARRTTISLIAGRFKKAGLINYMRGKITIEDRAALEQISCECYATVREHLLHYADSEIELGRHRITSPPLGHLRNGQI